MISAASRARAASVACSAAARALSSAAGTRVARGSRSGGCGTITLPVGLCSGDEGGHTPPGDGDEHEDDDDHAHDVSAGEQTTGVLLAPSMKAYIIAAPATRPPTCACHEMNPAVKLNMRLITRMNRMLRSRARDWKSRPRFR